MRWRLSTQTSSLRADGVPVSRAGSHDALFETASARPRSSPSEASCSDPHASIRTRSSSPSDWPISASRCGRKASSETVAAIWRRSFRLALERVDLLILTGGLGPTDDDLTRDVVAEVLGLPMEEDPAIVAGIEARFARRGLQMPAINRRQAMVPRGATVLDNPNGSAPGLLIQVGDRVVLLLPGPPREMKPMFEGVAAGFLSERVGRERFYRATIFIAGRSESHVEEAIQPIYATARDSRSPNRDDHSGGAGPDRGPPDRAVRRCRGGGGGARLRAGSNRGSHRRRRLQRRRSIPRGDRRRPAASVDEHDLGCGVVQWRTAALASDRRSWQFRLRARRRRRVQQRGEDGICGRADGDAGGARRGERACCVGARRRHPAPDGRDDWRRRHRHRGSWRRNAAEAGRHGLSRRRRAGGDGGAHRRSSPAAGP